MKHLRDFIKNTKTKLNFNDSKLNWELLNYKIPKFIISYSKPVAKKTKSQVVKIRKYAEIIR